MTKITDTARLNLRWAHELDADFIHKLVNDPDWLKHIGDRFVKNKKDAIHFINEKIINSYHSNGFGLYVMEQKSDAKPIGLCGLLKRPELPFVDIGYAMLPEYRGQGFTKEAVLSVLNWAKSTLAFNQVLAITSPSNTPSIKLLESISFVLQKEIFFAEANKPALLFEKTLV